MAAVPLFVVSELEHKWLQAEANLDTLQLAWICSIPHIGENIVVFRDGQGHSIGHVIMIELLGSTGRSFVIRTDRMNSDQTMLVNLATGVEPTFVPLF